MKLRFAIGLALLLFLMLWCVLGVFMFVGFGAFGFTVDSGVVLWVAIFIGCIWAIIAIFRGVRRQPRTQPPLPMPERTPAQQHQSSEEKLAHLVKKPEGRNPNPN